MLACALGAGALVIIYMACALSYRQIERACARRVMVARLMRYNAEALAGYDGCLTPEDENDLDDPDAGKHPNSDVATRNRRYAASPTVYHDDGRAGVSCCAYTWDIEGDCTCPNGKADHCEGS